MPGLDGLDLAKVLARFADRPQVVFVTAYEEHAVDAFELQATDYVMKPIRTDRLDEAVRRVVAAARRAAARERRRTDDDETIPVELGGVTRFIQRSQIRYASAHGDYARMHTADGSHLVRVSLNALEERWGDKGFVRIHRSTLVSLPTSPRSRATPGAPGARRRRRAARSAGGTPGPCATGCCAPSRPVSEPPTAGPPRRVRVTSPRDGRPAGAGARRPRRPGAPGADRPRGGLPLGPAAGPAAAVGRDPARRRRRGPRPAGAVRPPPRDPHVQVGPIPLPWLVIGVLIYPVVFVAARIYVHQAERIEREFSDLMGPP